MTTLTTTAADRIQTRHDPRVLLTTDDTVTPLLVLMAAAALGLAIAIIHLQDQGGLLGSESPTWMKFGYYAVEIGSVVSAGLVLRGKAVGWLVGLAFSVGPMVGYLLSRTVGVPGDSGDIGNWGYTLGTVSLMVEGAFIVLALMALGRLLRQSDRG